MEKAITQFKYNRYSSKYILNLWENADKESNIVTIESESEDFSIDIDGHKSIDSNLVIDFLSNIKEFDNTVQKFTHDTYIKGNYEIRNYIVSLEWISFKKNEVMLGYWGEFVNIELRAIFNLKDGIWKNINIYYQ